MAFYVAALRSRYLGQLTINTFTYRSDVLPTSNAGASTLITLMGLTPGGVITNGSILGHLRDVLSDQFTFLDVTARDLHSDVDFAERVVAPGTTGLLGGQPLPSFVAYSLRTARGRGDIRRGFKRFAGVTEAAVEGNLVTFQQALDSLAALAAAMSATLTGGSPETAMSFAPVVLGREQYDPDTGLPSTTSGSYRFYPTEVEQNAHYFVANTWNAQVTLSTQNSRKMGRGI